VIQPSSQRLGCTVNGGCSQAYQRLLPQRHDVSQSIDMTDEVGPEDSRHKPKHVINFQERRTRTTSMAGAVAIRVSLLCFLIRRRQYSNAIFVFVILGRNPSNVSRTIRPMPSSCSFVKELGFRLMSRNEKTFFASAGEWLKYKVIKCTSFGRPSQRGTRSPPLD
jgi:hypothetical protein